MSNECDQLLDECAQVTTAIRKTLDELVSLVGEIDTRLHRLAILRPDVSRNLVGDVVLRARDKHASSNSELTVCACLPGGIGMCIWSGESVAADMAAEVATGSPSFVRFADIPPLLQRLLVPQVEQVIGALRRRLRD